MRGVVKVLSAPCDLRAFALIDLVVTGIFNVWRSCFELEACAEGRVFCILRLNLLFQLLLLHVITKGLNYDLFYLLLRKNLWGVLQIELGDILCGKELTIILIGSCKHCGDQPSRACSSNDIKVVYYPCILSIKLLLHQSLIKIMEKFGRKKKLKKDKSFHSRNIIYLEFWFEKRKDSSRDYASYTATINAKHCDQPSLTRWRVCKFSNLASHSLKQVVSSKKNCYNISSIYHIY